MDRLKEALHIDFTKPKSVEERLVETIASLKKASLKLEAAAFMQEEGEDIPTSPDDDKNSNNTNNQNDDRHGVKETEKETMDDKPLIEGCGVTAGDIRALYSKENKDKDNNDAEDSTKADKVIFVLKLCLAQLATGQATVDSEVFASAVAHTLGLGHLRVELGPRQMLASFGSDCGHVILLETRRNIVLCKLADITHLAILMANEFTSDAKAANLLLDEIMEAPLPFGWLTMDVFGWMFATMAAIFAFFGSYYDMAIVAIISLVVTLTQHVVDKFPVTLKPIEVILVCTVVGVCASAAWRYIMDPLLEEERCHVRVIFLSPLLIYLPGNELVYGAYEVKMGQVVVGASRLVGAAVRCMFMASGLTIGWQAFGYGIIKDEEGAKGAGSLVPWRACPAFTLDDINPYNVGPWWMVWGIYLLIFLIPSFGLFNVHPVNFVGTYLVAYPSLLFFGFLNFGCDDRDCQLPSYLINMLVLFFAASLSCIREFLTGIPAVSALIPVLLILAPGSDAVGSMLKLMQAETDINVGQSSDIFVALSFQGVSYSLGMFLAFALWAPLLNKRRAKLEREKNTIEMSRRSAIKDRW